MKTTVFVAAALLLAPLPTLSQEAQRTEAREPANVERSADRGASSDQLRGEFRERMAAAIETIQDACADDIDEFCSRVTTGGVGWCHACGLSKINSVAGVRPR